MCLLESHNLKIFSMCIYPPDPSLGSLAGKAIYLRSIVQRITAKEEILPSALLCTARVEFQQVYLANRTIGFGESF